jgi:MoaD family protein
MKRVTVRFFAAFRDAAGVERVEVESGAETLSALFDEMVGRYAGLEREDAALAAVNDVMVPWSAPFADGDEVLFFPPVSGG